MTASSLARPKGPRPSDKYIPLGIALFFVAFVGLLLWFALLAVQSYSGVVTTNAYQKGLRYNEMIQTADGQDALPWTVALTPEMDRAGLVTVTATVQALGAAEAVVELWLRRPTHAGQDWQARLLGRGDGVFTSPPALLPSGIYQARITVRANGQEKQFSQQLMVP